LGLTEVQFGWHALHNPCRQYIYWPAQPFRCYTSNSLLCLPISHNQSQHCRIPNIHCIMVFLNLFATPRQAFTATAHRSWYKTHHQVLSTRNHSLDNDSEQDVPLSWPAPPYMPPQRVRAHGGGACSCDQGECADAEVIECWYDRLECGGGVRMLDWDGWSWGVERV
jgi:hypothetical protein